MLSISGRLRREESSASAMNCGVDGCVQLAGGRARASAPAEEDRTLSATSLCTVHGLVRSVSFALCPRS
jgi:hypothetical protein